MFDVKTVNKQWFAMMLVAFGLIGSAWSQEEAQEEAVPESAATVETAYYAWDKAAQKITGPHMVQAIPVTDAVTTLEDGKWYVIRRDEKGGALKRSPLYVYGDAHLILEDGCDMTVDAANLSKEGDIPAVYLQSPQYLEDTVSSISIYGQEKGNGRLVAIGGPCSAGIGCGQKAIGAGTVNIHGGRIEACGGDKGGAAIGTGIAAQGFFNSPETEPCTFNVNIYGGQVQATAATGSGAPAIGAGRDNRVPRCALAVMGGEVIAKGPIDSVTSAFGWGENCECPYDLMRYDYLALSVGRGLMLLAGSELDGGNAERMTAASYRELVGQGARIPYAHVMVAPTTKVTVPAVDNASYVISTNGVPMTDVDGRATLADREFPGVAEIEVVYTADNGYLMDGKRRWAWFVGRTEQEGASDFMVMPPSALPNSMGDEFVVAQPLTVERKRVYSSGGLGKSRDYQESFTLDLPQAALASGEAYFWVVFKEITDKSGMDEEQSGKIWDRRNEFLSAVSFAIDRPVGTLEEYLQKAGWGSSIYAPFKDPALFYAETELITDVAAGLPATLPNDATTVYVFKTRAGGKGDEDAKVLTAGGSLNTRYGVDRWSNELAGDRISISYFAWDAEQGKVVKQPAVEAIPLAQGSDGGEIVLHGNTWYAVLGNRSVGSIRVDVGTAHLIVAEGADFTVACGATVDADAKLAIYSEGDPTGRSGQSGDVTFTDDDWKSYDPLGLTDRTCFSGGTLEVHGCYVQCGQWSSRTGEAIRNVRTVQYAGELACRSSSSGTCAVNSRVLDIYGGSFECESSGRKDGRYVDKVIAGEQDGVRCVLNVHTGAEVEIWHEGLYFGESSGRSAIDAKLDIRLDPGVYAWSCQSGSSAYKLTTVAAYRANPVGRLLFCSSDEEVLPQDYRITAVYDDSSKTNGFTLVLPPELRSGEKWMVVGFDEATARQGDVIEDMPISFDDMIQLEYAMMIMEGGVIAGVDMLAADVTTKGFGGGLTPCYSVLTEECNVTIPASAGVDMIMVMRVRVSDERMPAYSIGMTTKLQSLADGETADGGVAMVQKQDFAVNRDEDGALTLVLPDDETLKAGERWAWMALPSGLPFGDDPLAMFREELGTVFPVGALNFDVFFDEMLGDLCIGSGVTTERVIPLPEGTDLLIVSKTRPGMSIEMGTCEYLCLTFGAAAHLNDPGHATWPRHDEYFPTADDFCTVTLPKVDGAEFSVAVDGTVVGYRPDGVYTVQKGSEVRVAVLVTDPENYELRSPSVLVYPNVWSDVTVGPQDVVVVEKSEATPIVGQGFVVRRDTEGNLTVDMSGEAALNNGEMWVCMTIDRSTSEFAEMESGDFFGDLAWRDCPQLVGGRLVGEVTLDMLMMIPGAENLVVTTNSVFAIPSDSELVMVSRAYDGYDGKAGSERYRALSLGGVRRVSELLPGAAVEGERWDAPHQVRYSAWDGEKIVHGLTTNALPLTAASFGEDGRLAVTKDSVYVVYGRIRDMDNPVIDIADGVTLSLIVADGAKLELGRIHVPSKATLNLYGQDDCSGVIDVASYRFVGGMVPLVGGEGTEACGTINIHGGMLAVYDFREDLTKAAIGSCDAATGANGTLNVYRGDVYVNGENAIGIGGYHPMQVRVLGGSITVEDGAIFGLGTKQSGISMGEGYQLLLGDAMNEAANVTSVGEYEKLMASGMPKKCVRIVRPAAIRFDAEIAALVASGKLTVRVICQSEVQKFAKVGDDVSSDVVWTKDGGTYALGCGDRAHVVFIANDKDSTRRSDVMSFACIAGDVSVALADLKWRDQESVAAQEFEVTRRLDGQFKLMPNGQLAEGEAWLWIALPESIAKITHPLSGQPLEETVAQQFEQMVKSGIYYIGGKFDAGGELRISRELRPLFNCFQSDNMGIPFLPMDGFHWGISKEKEVFYAPADSEFVMFCKVYDAGIAQLLFSAINEKEKPSKKAVKAGALTAKKKSSLIDEELAMMLGCRYMAESIGTATELQKLPRLPECEPGDIGNPWPLGPNDAEPVAYTNDTNTLVIKGKGPFAEPTKKPWLEEGVGPITEIVIKDPETELPDDIFEGLGTPEPIGINLPDGWPADDLPVPGQPWHGGYVKIEEGHWPLTISNVKFQQRYPWNGLVDITFELTGSTNVELGVWAKAGSTTIAASNFVGRTDMKFAVEGQKTVKLVWDADKDLLADGLVKLVLENVTITVGTVTKIGAESAAGLIDLAKGARVARDIENIVIDPKWGDAASATVLWPKAEAPRTYEQATVAPWDTDRLPAGQYEFAYKAGSTDYTAAFWLPADNWMVIDHETITEERPVTGEKVLVAGESVIKSGGKLVIEGEPEIIWDGAFKVEDGGKIYAPYFNVIVDPETGLVTLEPKAKPEISGLRFSQRYPWNGLVDVFFTASYAKDPAAKVWVKLAAKLNDEEKQVNTLYLAADLKTANTQFEVAQGEVHLVWDTMKDVGLENFGALEITAQAALIRMAEAEEEPEQPEDAPEPLCFMAMENAGLSVALNGDFKESPVLEYSTDGVKWEPVKFGAAMKVYAKEKVYLRGLNPKGLSFGDQTYVTIETKGKFEVSGDVMSLIDYRKAVTEIPNEYCFFRLFYNSSITSAPKLSASVLKDCCYWEMFYGSESLLAGPDLPAEFVPSAAYCLMFANCTSLSSVGCGANNVEFGDAFKSWLDNVMPKGVIYIIGNGDPVLLEKLNALPPDWGFGKPLKADTFEELKAEAK